MVLTVTVIGLNLALAGVCWLAAWRLWCLRYQLVQITNQLDYMFHRAHILDAERLPELILQGQQMTASLRRKQAILRQQLRLLGQILALVRWWRVGRWRRR